MNYTNETDIQYEDEWIIAVVGTIVNGTIFLTGVLGNILVVAVVRATRSMHSPTNCYLVSNNKHSFGNSNGTADWNFQRYGRTKLLKFTSKSWQQGVRKSPKVFSLSLSIEKTRTSGKRPSSCFYFGPKKINYSCPSIFPGMIILILSNID